MYKTRKHYNELIGALVDIEFSNLNYKGEEVIRKSKYMIYGFDKDKGKLLIRQLLPKK